MPYDNALGANNITKSLAYNIILVYGTIRSIKLWPYLRKVWKQYFNRSVVAAMVEYLRKVLCGHCYGESLETIYWTVLWATAMKFTIGIFLAKKIFVHGLLSIGYIFCFCRGDCCGSLWPYLQFFCKWTVDTMQWKWFWHCLLEAILMYELQTAKAICL